MVITCILTLDEDGETILNQEPLIFQFGEIESIKDNYIRIGEATNQCDASAAIVVDQLIWEKLVKVGGDFSKIGICLKTNSPIPNSELGLMGL